MQTNKIILKKLFLRYFVSGVCLLICDNSFGFILEGKIVDSESRQGIPYVNVGVLNKKIGTVSSEKGLFKIDLTNALSSDTLKFFCLGYEPIYFTVKEAETISNNDSIVIALDKKLNLLKEISVSSNRPKRKTLGNTNKNKIMVAEFMSNIPGAEVGTILKIKKSTKLLSLNYNIANNNNDSLIFRANIYSTTQEGTPDKLLYSKIYTSNTIKKRGGLATIDVSNENLFFSADIFISFELIHDYKDNSLYFPIGIIGADSFVKEASEVEWRKSPISVGFYAIVSQ